jgi:hypothetical protein
MLASSHSLQLTVIGPKSRRGVAGLILVVLTLGGSGAMGQERERQPRADQCPIAPSRVLPAQDRWQLALGGRLFHDTRLSHIV